MLQLFFVEDIQSPNLIGDNAHHAGRVLRMKSGEEILVSDGKGSWARCQITSISKKEIGLNITESGKESAPDAEISILQALPKSDRARETVELLTAAGVTNIYPWQAARSIGKESDKWESYSIEASKQSRRYFFPKVSEKINSNSAIEICKEFDQVLICHESATHKLTDVVKPAKRTLIIIGPEGGISENELTEFETAGGKSLKLGRPILRSAHAGIAAISAVSAAMKVW
jgi:16S rRNA (uracil1498-N3)-methyltransferase